MTESETGSQTSARLLEVIAHADFEVFPDLYAFAPLGNGTGPLRKDALACVRDDGAWSQLVPVDDPATPMAFHIFSFHFDPAFDATGFVGWRYSHLARTTGTGHIVVCGRGPRHLSSHEMGWSAGVSGFGGLATATPRLKSTVAARTAPSASRARSRHRARSFDACLTLG